MRITFKEKYFLTYFIVFFVSISATCIIEFSNKNLDGYEYMVLLPLTFLLVYTLFLQHSIFWCKSIVVLIFTIASFFRYIVLPVILSYADVKYLSIATSPKPEYIVKGIYLMVYELLFIGILLYFASNYLLKGRISKKIDNINQGKIGYICILILVVVILIINPSSRGLINFFFIKSEEGERVSENLTTINLLIRQIMFISSIILFNLIVKYSIKKHYVTGKNKYILYSLLSALLLVSVIIGERRTVQVYLAFSASYTLGRVFPKNAKKIFITIAVLALFVLGGMTIYKNFYAFRYDSYAEAIQHSSFDINNLGEQMQAYFLGPFNTGFALELSDKTPQPISRLFYDIGRSFIGINFFVKDKMLTTSEVFNWAIYNEYRPSGQLIPISGQGYMYFGFIGAPILLGLIMVFAIYLEKRMRNSKSLELCFFLSYIIMRLSTAIIMSNLQGVINTVTLFSISALLVYYGNKFLCELVYKKG